MHWITVVSECQVYVGIGGSFNQHNGNDDNKKDGGNGFGLRDQG